MASSSAQSSGSGSSSASAKSGKGKKASGKASTKSKAEPKSTTVLSCTEMVMQKRAKVLAASFFGTFFVSYSLVFYFIFLQLMVHCPPTLAPVTIIIWGNVLATFILVPFKVYKWRHPAGANTIKDVEMSNNSSSAEVESMSSGSDNESDDGKKKMKKKASAKKGSSKKAGKGAAASEGMCGGQCCSNGLIATNVCIYIIIVVVASVFFGLRGATYFSRTSDLKLPGLTASVKIEREKSGLVHITAENEHDLFFAQGAIAFQERGFQMEFFRRVYQGTLSEVLGNSTLGTDIFLRTLGMHRAAATAWDDVAANNKPLADIITAFIDGVNAYQDSKPALPLEFTLLNIPLTHFLPQDVLGMVKILAYDLCNNMDDEIQRYYLLASKGLSIDRIEQIFPDVGGPSIIPPEEMFKFTGMQMPTYETMDAKPKKPEAVRGVEYSYTPRKTDHQVDHAAEKARFPWRGQDDLQKHTLHSNNWVIGGGITQSGKPILANDPHLGLTLPAIWWPVHLSCPSTNLDVMGVSVALAPGTVIGRNKILAWGMTNVGTDVQDMYIMEENTANTDQYMYNGTYHDYTILNEVLKVKGKDDYPLKVKISSYGPVFTNLHNSYIPPGASLSLRWVALDATDSTAFAYMQTARATTFAEFRTAMFNVISPAQNAIYGDINGNIGYHMQGVLPTRVAGHSGKYPVPGNGSYEWTGFVAESQRPYLENPTQGYIVTANAKVVPDGAYNYSILTNSDFADPFRTERIYEMVAAFKPHTPQSVQQMQYDRKSLLFVNYFKGVVNNLLGNPNLSEDGKAWLNAMAAWDGNATGSSEEATMFYTWYNELSTLLDTETGREDFGGHMTYFANVFTSGSDAACDARGMSCGDFAVAQLDVAIKKVGAKPGAWEKSHFYRLLNTVLGTAIGCAVNRDVPTGGGPDTVAVAPMNTNYTASHGPSMRWIADLSDLEKSMLVIPGGLSENIFDHLYDNTVNDWRDMVYYPMRMANYEVETTANLVPA